MEPIAYLFALFHIAHVWCSEAQLTVNIEPGDEECFYGSIEAGEKLALQYHVVQKGETEALISFYLTAPPGKIVASKMSSKSQHSFTAEAGGDYKACFGNFLTASRKQVYFTVSAVGGRPVTDWLKAAAAAAHSAADLDVRLLGVEHAVKQIRQRLHQAGQQQRLLRLLMARDRSLAEANFELVNRWSAVQLLAMAAVLAAQVLVVRNLFCGQIQLMKRLERWREGWW